MSDFWHLPPVILPPITSREGAWRGAAFGGWRSRWDGWNVSPGLPEVRVQGNVQGAKAFDACFFAEGL